MKRLKNVLILCSLVAFSSVSAQEHCDESTKKEDKKDVLNRLSIGGYGEVVLTRNYYSDQWQRYSNAEKYKDEKSHGRFDLPHVVISLGYDFGKGWSFGSEIEFEHGGTGSAVEIEAEEAGEYETETERGGEVVLEQFWIQKSFSRAFNIRAGHIIVPVGMTNQYHLPTEFFTNYRPEGESTILPCTWHETGISFWGRTKNWRYEVQFLAGLDADRFDSENFINGGSGSPYEFKIANTYAGAFRLDNYSIRNLRLAVSGYFGYSFDNSLTKNTKYKDCKGEVMIGSFDFHYNSRNFIVRGNFDWAHLNDSEEITQFNKSMSNASPSPKMAVASDAVAAGIELGYDIFTHVPKMNQDDQKLYLFGRYEYYDSMAKVEKNVLDHGWCGKQRMALGVNYYPLKEVVVKAEFSKRFYKSQYNNEPSVSLGIAYAGFFTK
ncbi:hypothetical protein [Bacteroides sp. 51]|uniref:hypothetical protein n=1 Tax=Bacteroides sp. 51 TaxID=2302938 RepID=UPI0013D5D60A|nr:hypothetical protein [Bacteroides sp. 51]NDV82975.1 hypothetical protein [Bacteroides sp. 51]